MKNIFKIMLAVSLSVLLIYTNSQAQNGKEHFFYVLPLGVSGGEFQDNLSAYLVSPMNDNHFVALDAGVLCSAIKNIPPSILQELNIQASPNHSIKATFFTDNIKSYLISHAHIDHIAGLVTCSTIDSSKEIFASPSTINYLRDDIFNWKIWPNFADAGQKPQLQIYHYHPLKMTSTTSLAPIPFKVQAFPLSHGSGYPSTAFLLDYQNHFLLYFGDTGADLLEKSDDIHRVWQVIAPLIRSHRLKAIFMEASYPNQRADKLLFGHLTPAWLLFELNELAEIVNPKQPETALAEVPVVVTHIKQGLENGDNAKLIEQQLLEKNKLRIHFIIPQPLEPLIF